MRTIQQKLRKYKTKPTVNDCWLLFGDDWDKTSAIKYFEGVYKINPSIIIKNKRYGLMLGVVTCSNQTESRT